MQFIITIPDHTPCPGGCDISTGEKAEAAAFGITEAEAHALATATLDILFKVVQERRS